MSQPPPPPPPPPGGQPPYGGQNPGYHPIAPDHPDAMTVLVLGILSVVVCGLTGPFAWYKGNAALEDIRASGGAWGGEGTVNAGRICGIVGTLLMAVPLVFLLVWVLILIGVGAANGGF